MKESARYIFLIVACLMFGTVTAQNDFSTKALKKELKGKMKAEKYADADNILRKAMDEHKELMLEPEYNFLEMEIQNKLAESENRKIFLGAGQDTAKYFSYVYGVYKYALSTGYSNKKYHRTISNNLLQYRNNLRSAAVYHFKKSNYDEAFKYVDMYMATTDYPLLTSNKAYQMDGDTVALARLASISAFGAKQYSSALYYLNMAMTDTVNIMNMYEIGVKASMARGDTLASLGYMKAAWQRDSTNEFICFALLDYYQQKHEYDSVLFVISTALHSVPSTNDSTTEARLFYIKGKAEELSGDETSALSSMDSVISKTPLDVKPYQCKGNIYIRQAQAKSADNVSAPGTEAYKKTKAEINSLYSLALTEFEMVRKLSPEESSLWLSQLRECYYKLNKGKELKKLEQYEKKS